MKGVCAKCACTSELPCVGPGGATCGWMDEHEDLCSRCAYDLAQSGFKADTLDDAKLCIRVIGSQLQGVIGHVLELKRFHLAIAEGMAAAGEPQPGEVLVPRPGLILPGDLGRG